jgi:mxaJ protein
MARTNDRSLGRLGGWASGALLLAAVIAAVAAGGPASVYGDSAQAAGTPALRVCADPDNMPFSNARGDGFENRLASLMAGDLGRHLAYVWAPEDDNFIHDTLAAKRCDMVVGVPRGLASVGQTQPYY